MKKRQPRAVARMVSAAALGGLLLVGCTDGLPDARPFPEGTARAPSPQRPGAGESAALGAYRSMWRDVIRASSRSHAASSPALDEHASGAALELVRFMMQEDDKKQVVIKGDLVLDPSVVRSHSTVVNIRDCADATDWLQYAHDGSLADRRAGGHHQVDATVRRRDGAWKVESLRIGEVGSC